MNPDQLADVLRALGYGAYVPVAFAVVGLAAKVAAVAPPATPTSSPAWKVFRMVLDVVGGNWGRAQNAVPAAAPVATAAPALLVLLALSVPLTACGTATSTAEAPRQAIFAAASAYEGALALATDYANLPPCGVGGPVACAEPAAVKKIAAIVATATPVVTGAVAIAEGAQPDSASLQTALAAVQAAASGLSSLAATLKVK